MACSVVPASDSFHRDGDFHWDVDSELPVATLWGIPFGTVSLTKHPLLCCVSSLLKLRRLSTVKMMVRCNLVNNYADWWRLLHGISRVGDSLSAVKFVGERMGDWLVNGWVIGGWMDGWLSLSSRVLDAWQFYSPWPRTCFRKTSRDRGHAKVTWKMYTGLYIRSRYESRLTRESSGEVCN